MTETQPAQQTKQEPLAPGQLVGLITLTVLTLIASVVLGIVALVNEGERSASVELIAGLAWWSGFMLVASVISFVGVLVLAGVRRLLGTAGFRV